MALSLGRLTRPAGFGLALALALALDATLSAGVATQAGAATAGHGTRFDPL
ncbi:hypothetical protein ACWEJ6_40380 [Nonomuraea sp. NPDC004702]